MKIFAQHGYGDATAKKTLTAMQKNFIDGVIFSPRDIKDKVLDEVKGHFLSTNKIFLFDPQVYVSTCPIAPDWRLKNLINYHYFCKHDEKEFSRERNIEACINEVIDYELNKGFTTLLAPNIFIKSSFDSTSAGKAANFIAISGEIWQQKRHEKQQLFATMAVSIEALDSLPEIKKFISEILNQEPKVNGIYIVVNFNCKTGEDVFFSAKQLTNLLYLIYVLQNAEFNVIIGYADIYIPLFAMVGAYGGATGLFSSQKRFSLSTFQPTVRKGGGKRAHRYLSSKLQLRLKITDLNILRSFFSDIEVMNGFSQTDILYRKDSPELEDPANESLQTWETLQYLSNQFLTNDISSNISNMSARLDNSIALIKKYNQRLEDPLNFSILENMKQAIINLKELVEL